MRAYHLLLLVLGCSGSYGSNIDCPHGCECVDRKARCMKSKLDDVPTVPNNTVTLDLRGNNIAELNSTKLLHLAGLQSFLLSYNRLTALKGGILVNLPELRFLYLCNNKIRDIDADAFRGLYKLEQLYLHENEIEKLSPDVFTDLVRLKRLFLHSNRLNTLPDAILSNSKQLERLRLDDNPLVCDCRMVHFITKINSNDTEKSRISLSGSCLEPSIFQGTAISSLKPKDLHCDGPVILRGPEDVTVDGDRVVFSCKVFGIPEPQVVWLRDSTEIPLQDNHYHVLGNGSLIIENPAELDDGVYSCMAKSVMGEAKSRPARMVVDSKKYGIPVFSKPPLDATVKSGEELRLNCLVKAKPRPRIQWRHNNEKILLNDRIKVLSNGTLVVATVGLKDSGVYLCRVENEFGTLTATAKVEVRSPPHFTQTTPDITAVEGERVELICKAEGNPKPLITWYKNSQPLIYSKGSTTMPAENYVIESVQQADQGIYSCFAENSDGVIDIETLLTVSTKFTDKPLLIIKPIDLEAALGTSVEIPCRSGGDPYPKIVWHKNGNVLSASDRIKISALGNLYIANVTQLDTGRYECSAINELGRESASALLTIKGSLFIGDEFVTQALAEAMDEIGTAINNTVETLFSTNQSEKITHTDLMKRVKFPNPSAREIAKTAEIYERTLVNIRKYVARGEKIASTETFNYKDILSPEHLELIARLSGCTEHRKTPDCTNKCYHNKYRSFDGTCNNFNNTLWGASLTGFRRILPAIYENGFSQPVGWDQDLKYNGYKLPSARLVSSRLITTPVVTPDTEITHMVMQWGQFLDHDIDHSLPAVSSQTWDGIDCKKSCEYAAPCFPIEIPINDTRVANRRCIDFIRTSAVCGSGTTSVFFGEVQPREQVNQLTSYIDASQVYGYEEEVAADLRNLQNSDGLLKVGLTFPGAKPLLPFATGTQGIDCRRNLSESSINCFAAGDIRVNEQIGLTAMHTLWMREHNRIAVELKKLNPYWDGDKLYQESRKIVGAMMQHITYKEWLPIILDKQSIQKLGKFQKYNPNVDASISNVFATAALRFGHSLINPVLERLDENFETIGLGNLPLHDAFFSPWRLTDEGGTDPLIRGMFMSPAKLKKPQETLNSELTETLFQTAHAVALDLAAMNIQRSRDHALPPYNRYRQFCNLTQLTSFDDSTFDIRSSTERQILKELYGSPDNIDVWVGGILEEQLPDSKVGPLFSCLLIEQFKRLREGDRFFYENPTVFSSTQLQEIKKTTLARVICDNGDNIDTITENVFILPEHQELIDCNELPALDYSPWQECSECYNKDTIRMAKRLEDTEKEVKELIIHLIETRERMKFLEDRLNDEN